MTPKKPTSTPIYYRDLSPTMKHEVRGEIADKPGLLDAIWNDDDVTVGYWLLATDYHKDD